MSHTATIDTCDHGHKFAKLDDHPGNSCVHCLRIGLASARAEVVRLDKQCREAVAAALGFMRGGDYAWSYLLQQIKEITSAEGKQPVPDVSESKSKTPKESWWAGYRAGKGLAANTPRQDAIAAPDVDVLVEALEAISRNELDAQRAQRIAAVALAAHRKLC